MSITSRKPADRSKHGAAAAAAVAGQSILVVDDLDGNRDVLQRRLEHRGFRVFCAASGAEALQFLSREAVSLILLDVMMPGMDGFEVLQVLRERLAGDMPPVIMLTARDAPEEVARAFELGAVDHVTKPVNFQVLDARIRHHLDLSLTRVELSRHATELERTVAFMGQRQYLDNLTGLYNLRGLELEMSRCLDQARSDGAVHGLCVLAVEDLPAINHTFGPAAGDEVLRYVARVLRSEMGQPAALSRFRGDKFAIVVDDLPETGDWATAQRLRDRITSSPVVVVDGEELWISVSLGACRILPTDASVAVTIHRAEHACAIGGRSGIGVADAEGGESEQIRSHLRWAMKLKGALRHDRLALYAQPIVATGEASPCLRRFEVLVRMVEDDRVVSPGLFLPACERHGLSAELDRWVIDHALDHVAAHAGADLHRININLSGHSLSSREFSDYIRSRVSERSVDPTRICFEITETAAVTNLDEATALMRSLQELGVTFALDDFGSGVSSFSYLRSLAVDCLKIDGQFVRHVNRSPLDQIIVKSICEVAAVMGMTTVAEFVEDDEIVQTLARTGVDYLQGYHIGKPLPISQYIRQPDRRRSP